MSTTAPRPFCFVLMPFEDAFDDVYQLGIAAACKDAGAYAERVDQQIFTESILDRVYNQIGKADIVVADMSGRNPNVFYEVGYAHALGKATVLLTQSQDDIPFDLKHFPHIIYNGKVSFLKSQLTTKIRHLVKHPPRTKSEIQFDLDLLHDGRSIVGDHTALRLDKHDWRYLEFVIANKGTEIRRSEDYEVSILANAGMYTAFNGGLSKRLEVVSAPDGRDVFIYDRPPPLFPGSYRQIAFCLVPSKTTEQNSAIEYVPVTVRMTTSHHTAEFTFVHPRASPAVTRGGSKE